MDVNQTLLLWATGDPPEVVFILCWSGSGCGCRNSFLLCLAQTDTNYNPATGLRPPSATVVSAEPFSHGTGTLRCLQKEKKEMATCRHWSVSLWRDPDDASYCRILSPDKTEWRLISATLCRWRCCFVADQLWFMTRIQEEEDSPGVMLQSPCQIQCFIWHIQSPQGDSAMALAEFAFCECSWFW